MALITRKISGTTKHTKTGEPAIIATHRNQVPAEGPGAGAEASGRQNQTQFQPQVQEHPKD